MGRVRHESPLRGRRLRDARQQAPDRDNEGPDLGGQARIGHLTPVRFRAELEIDRNPSQRSHHPADDDADHERQEKDQAQEGRNCTQRALVRDLGVVKNNVVR